MDSSTPGLPLLHYLLELAPVHVYWIGDAIQTSHFLPLSPLFAFNLSQHRVFSKSQLFASGGQTTGVSVSASALSMNIQGWFPLRLTGLVSFNVCFSAVLSFACLLGYLTSMNYVNNLRFILMFFPVLKIYNELSIHDFKGVYHGFPYTWDCIIYAFLYLSHSVTW